MEAFPSSEAGKSRALADCVGPAGSSSSGGEEEGEPGSGLSVIVSPSIPPYLHS